LRRAIEIDPEYAAAWFQLALSHEEQSRLPAAIEAWTVGLTRDPVNAAARGRLNQLTRMDK